MQTVHNAKQFTVEEILRSFLSSYRIESSGMAFMRAIYCLLFFRSGKSKISENLTYLVISELSISKIIDEKEYLFPQDIFDGT